MIDRKKSYRKPNLEIYGNIKDITLKKPGPADSLLKPSH